MIYSSLLRPLLFRFDPERVHEVVLRCSQAFFHWAFLERAVGAMLRVNDPVQLAGLTFPNRVGLAAGFDKNGHFVASARALGFGHLEVGAVTPLPQSGHPRPRLFRVSGEPSLRNRMGFNNDGAAAIIPRLPKVHPNIVVGVNLGKGSATPLEEAARDYLQVLELAYPRCDYFSINISSPNTADLRELGRGSRLRALCAQLVSGNRREAERNGCRPRPLWLKVSPDCSDDELKELAEVTRQTELNGLIATNTTVRREGPYAGLDPLGGLSGRALRIRSLEVVRLLRAEVGPGFPIIGVGGVLEAGDALAMREAGADLVQVYTGFIYGGPGLPRKLAEAMKRR